MCTDGKEQVGEHPKGRVLRSRRVVFVLVVVVPVALGVRVGLLHVEDFARNLESARRARPPAHHTQCTGLLRGV